MNFSRGLTNTDYFFLISFLIIYGVYFYKILKASRALKTSASNSLVKFLIRSTYLGLMLIAALAPNFGVTEVEAREQGKDIFFAFDLSESMNANDVEPSRLDRVKSEILSMLHLFETDRLGIVVFNSDPYILSPLTYDRENVDRSIRALRTNLLDKGSTDLSSVFNLIGEKMATSSGGKAKAVIVITDGESHFSMRRSDIDSVLNNKISVFLVGVGSLGGSAIPTLTGTKKDRDGHEVISKLDITQINDYAKATKGKYYLVNNVQNDIPKLIEDLSNLVGSSDDIVHQSVTYNKYIVFLLLALLLIVVDFLITIKVLKI